MAACSKLASVGKLIFLGPHREINTSAFELGGLSYLA